MCVYLFTDSVFFTVHNCNIRFVLSDSSVFQKNRKRENTDNDFFFPVKCLVIIFMKLFSDILKRG